jgi:acyl carrier protein
MPAADEATPPLDSAIRTEIARQLGVAVERIMTDASLVDDLGVDSLLHMTMVVGLEQRFEIMIPDAIAARFTSVGDVTEAVRSRATATGSGGPAADAGAAS